MKTRGIWYRRVIVSCATLFAMVSLQVQRATPLNNGDHQHMPLLKVSGGGIETTEAEYVPLPKGPDMQNVHGAENGSIDDEVPIAAVREPTRLRIPAIDIDAPIVRVGLLEGGKMEAPPDARSVGWYVYGVRPGERGAAVLDGHLELGNPGVFWDLHRLKPGDALHVTDDAGMIRTFRVTRSAEYDMASAPMEEIFVGNRSEATLNLITCAGTWRPAIGHYDRRLVLFTRAAE